MARIAGVDLPRNKRANIALTYIYGIGTSRSARILDAANVRSDRAIVPPRQPMKCARPADVAGARDRFS